ncbi:hypothetical protein C8K30_1011006 [Promicromonospora sp. AC04]|uniref:hypothetical protein n=1 Tax=Promicromonospora sp. AC04 TaxID=2135723 RepID=UPI000D3496D7|nr:hypothetical protein [Promicromonospora sp. AC04]PUB32480.1 hypothetical protein C8K30_1011006 [Promicromonospora sp. AC04]
MTTPQDQNEASPEQGRTGSAPRDEAAAAVPCRHRTAAELEARFDDWVMRQRRGATARTSQDRSGSLRRVFAATMGVGMVALAVAMGVTGESYDASRARNEARLVELGRQAAAAETIAQDRDHAGQVPALSKAAASDAEEVVTAQQAFAGLYRAASRQPSPNNGTPNRTMRDLAEHRRELAPLFRTSAYLVGDQEAYSWSTAASFDAASEIDPRYAWYVRYDGRVPADPRTYTWSLATVMPDLESLYASGTTNQAQVVWLCRDTVTDKVLAWASARYTHDGTAGVFDKLEVTTTTTGMQYQRTSSTALGAPSIPQIEQFAGPGENDGGNR